MSLHSARASTLPVLVCLSLCCTAVVAGDFGTITRGAPRDPKPPAHSLDRPLTPEEIAAQEAAERTAYDSHPRDYFVRAEPRGPSASTPAPPSGASAAAAAPAPGAAATGRNVAVVEFGQAGRKLGEFRQTAPKQWAEMNSAGAIVFRFEETQRDDGSVYLVDRSRGVNLQLNLGTRKVLYSDAGSKPRDLYDITTAR